MTMPSSGPLNMGGTTTPQSVANELGLGLTTTISMNQANVRTLAGVGGSGTTWSMNSLYGKSSIAIAQSLFASCDSTDGTAAFTFNDNGTMDYYDPALSNGDPNWATPTTAGIGSSYWVKITRTSGVTLLGMTSGTLYQISTVPTAYYNVSPGGFQASSGNVDIYSDAGGTTRVGGGTYSLSVTNP
jgi:hypothetical protein